MAQLVLGPILRHVEQSGATVWVETDGPCEVEVLGTRATTFHVEGHHYALIELSGLAPGETYEYEVLLDGAAVWPPAASRFPPSVIRTLDRDRVRLVFGSCRVSLPHHPPYTLDPSEHPEAQGIDALRALGLRMIDSPSEGWPDCLLMLGDQVYADDLSPAMREFTDARHGEGVPPDELEDFDQYALAYREAWGEPVIRWLLSTIPSAMIFDDHEIHAQWKISHAWLERMRAQPWYDRRISGGLMAYWIYQHIGNLSLSELESHDILERVRQAEDGGTVLREEMVGADRQPGHSRWSFSRDLGDVRLVVIDSRAGRELEPGRRQMIDDGEWDWVAERASGDFEHVLLASSVPFFLPPGLHYCEALGEAVADGAWGDAPARLAERLRQSGVMDHWAAFQDSFHRLASLLEDLSAGRGGRAPASVVMLSGDVHHCYLAEVGFRRQAGVRSAVWQAVCSAYRKELRPREKAVMKLGSTRTSAAINRRLAHAAGVKDPPLAWRLVHRPSYENQVATLEATPGSSHVRVETTAGSDWREPRLHTVFEQQLVGQPPSQPSEAPAGGGSAGRKVRAQTANRVPASPSTSASGLPTIRSKKQ